MLKLEGSLTALATPFRDHALDEEAFRKLIRHQLEGGTAGLVPMGTTGEASTLDFDEHVRAVQVTVEESKGRAPVVAGAGSNSTHEAIELVRRVRDVGADAALMVTPYYNKPTQDGLYAHYRAIAEAHPGFPLVLYNVPGRTGGDLLPDTCARLCELDEVVAIKDATANMIRALELVEKCGDRLTLLSGDDFTVLPFIACGGKGVVSVSSNVAPRMMADLVAAARAGKLAEARALQNRLQPLHRLLFIEANPGPVKWALHEMGLFGPELRLPLVPLSERHRPAVHQALVELGILK